MPRIGGANDHERHCEGDRSSLPEREQRHPRKRGTGSEEKAGKRSRLERGDDDRKQPLIPELRCDDGDQQGRGDAAHRVRRREIDVAGLCDDPARARYGDINWAAVIAALVGLVAGWSWEYGLVECMHGPIARATNNTDLSRLAAFVVSGALYYFLRPLLAREEQPTEAATPAA